MERSHFAKASDISTEARRTESGVSLSPYVFWPKEKLGKET